MKNAAMLLIDAVVIAMLACTVLEEGYRGQGSVAIVSALVSVLYAFVAAIEAFTQPPAEAPGE